jgi:hypothetical protein
MFVLLNRLQLSPMTSRSKRLLKRNSRDSRKSKQLKESLKRAAGETMGKGVPKPPLTSVTKTGNLSVETRLKKLPARKGRLAHNIGGLGETEGETAALLNGHNPRAFGVLKFAAPSPHEQAGCSDREVMSIDAD